MTAAPFALRRPPSRAAIVGRYVVFALVAGAANIAAQAALSHVCPSAPVMMGVLAGTAVGFAIKYALDKYAIFFDRFDGHAAEARKIAIYAIFSVGTTLIFWASELGALHIWGTPEARYAGAVLGLVVGNALKYRLDKRYVFAGAS